MLIIGGVLDTQVLFGPWTDSQSGTCEGGGTITPGRAPGEASESVA